MQTHPSFIRLPPTHRTQRGLKKDTIRKKETEAKKQSKQGSMLW